MSTEKLTDVHQMTSSFLCALTARLSLCEADSQSSEQIRVGRVGHRFLGRRNQSKNIVCCSSVRKKRQQSEVTTGEQITISGFSGADNCLLYLLEALLEEAGLKADRAES